jgi:hypothetical protein
MIARALVLPCVALAALLVVGCGGGGGAHDGSPQRDSNPYGDVESRVDRTTDDGGTPDDVLAPGDDGPLVGPTSGQLAVDFQADVTGHGTTRLGDVTVATNVVDYTLVGAAHVGVAYQHHVWAGYTLYDVVSIAADGSDLAVTYLYCQGTGLPYAYTESYTLAMDYEAASGTCSGNETAATVDVALPALAALPTAFDTGITISGTDLDLGASGGQVDLAGATWDVIPFNTVDCTTCPGGPWLEIHSVLVRPAEACFGIFYLYPDTPGTVQLSYTLCMPSLDRPDGVYTADWSGTLQTRLLQPRLWRPAAPPFSAMREFHGAGW